MSFYIGSSCFGCSSSFGRMKGARAFGGESKESYVVPSRVPYVSIAGVMPSDPRPPKPLFVVFRLDARGRATEPEFNF